MAASLGAHPWRLAMACWGLGLLGIGFVPLNHEFGVNSAALQAAGVATSRPDTFNNAPPASFATAAFDLSPTAAIEETEDTSPSGAVAVADAGRTELDVPVEEVRPTKNTASPTQVDEAPSAMPSPLPNRQAPPIEPAAAPKAAPCRGDFGTALTFARNPAEAARLAKQDKKLVFLLHVSGDFEDAGFT